MARSAKLEFKKTLQSHAKTVHSHVIKFDPSRCQSFILVVIWKIKLPWKNSIIYLAPMTFYLIYVYLCKKLL